MNNSEHLLKAIEAGIRQNGYHIVMVNGGQNPHFAYTVGLYNTFGFELVLAGGFISTKDYESKFHAIYAGLTAGADANSVFRCEGSGEMKLLEIHSSWSERMILGVYDYHNLDSVRAMQILQSGEALLDVPAMSGPFNEHNTIWKWLSVQWDKNTPQGAYVITNVQFLRGETVTEIMRFEDGYWEMFVGCTSEISDADVRVLPLGAMIGIDSSLEKAIELNVGDGLWRVNKNDGWHDWK